MILNFNMQDVDNKEITPIFRTHHTISRSLLTCKEGQDKIDTTKPISVFSIAKHYNLDKIFIADTSFSGFIDCVKSAEKLNKQLIFGIILTVCQDATKKDDESFKSENKIIIWLKNSAGYIDLCKLYSKAATDFFYYIPRLDWKTLQSYWTKNLILQIPHYDSFIFNNNMFFSICLPDFGSINPHFTIEDNNLPFDNIIAQKTKEYCKNKYEIINSKSIYYYKSADFLSYQVLRCINKRSNINKPNLDHCASNQFSFEAYLAPKGEKIKDE